MKYISFTYRTWWIFVNHFVGGRCLNVIKYLTCTWSCCLYWSRLFVNQYKFVIQTSKIVQDFWLLVCMYLCGSKARKQFYHLMAFFCANMIVKMNSKLKQKKIKSCEHWIVDSRTNSHEFHSRTSAWSEYWLKASRLSFLSLPKWLWIHFSLGTWKAMNQSLHYSFLHSVEWSTNKDIKHQILIAFSFLLHFWCIPSFESLIPTSIDWPSLENGH